MLAEHYEAQTPDTDWAIPGLVQMSALEHSFATVILTASVRNEVPMGAEISAIELRPEKLGRMSPKQ
jgi:hypothetical protein